MTDTDATWQYEIPLLKSDEPRVVYGVVYSPCEKGDTRCALDSQQD